MEMELDAPSTNAESGLDHLTSGFPTLSRFQGLGLPVAVAVAAAQIVILIVATTVANQDAILVTRGTIFQGTLRTSRDS